MTMTLYPWEIDMNLGRIEAERMLVLAKVEHSARGRILMILGFVKIQVENWG
jgi:hypothetical protein